jgi:hypothetical protein
MDAASHAAPSLPRAIVAALFHAPIQVDGSQTTALLHCEHQHTQMALPPAPTAECQASTNQVPAEVCYFKKYIG